MTALRQEQTIEGSTIVKHSIITFLLSIWTLVLMLFGFVLLEAILQNRKEFITALLSNASGILDWGNEVGGEIWLLTLCVPVVNIFGFYAAAKRWINKGIYKEMYEETMDTIRGMNRVITLVIIAWAVMAFLSNTSKALAFLGALPSLGGAGILICILGYFFIMFSNKSAKKKS